MGLDLNWMGMSRGLELVVCGNRMGFGEKKKGIDKKESVCWVNSIFRNFEL